MRIRIAITLPFAILIPLIASAMTSGYTRFQDVPSDAWFSSSVQEAVDLGIVSGYKDAYGNLTGTFGPEDPVTFAQALKIALESAGFDVNLGQGYGHWAAKYVSIAIGERFSLAPNQNIDLDRFATRAEVASLIADAFRVSISPAFTSAFSDVIASDRFAFEIAALKRDGVLRGDVAADGNPTGMFRPDAPINRAETVKIAIAARQRYRSGSSSSRSSASSASSCAVYDCGERPLGMPNWQCPDGSLGGPACQKLPSGSCGWLIRSCISSSHYSSFSSSPRSSSSSSSSTSSVKAAVVVLYTSTGFTPSVVRIGVNQTVRFINTVDDDLRVSSNPHPSHTSYPGFDSGFSVLHDSDYVFTFTKKGTWGYHNHYVPSRGGQVVVE